MSSSSTSIAWTDITWNPTRGCRRISPGCERCYAERQAYRFSQPTPKTPHPPYEGLVELGKNGPRWTGRGRLITSALEEPRSWKKTARVFVDSMSDLFFEEFDNEEIAAVFGIMANHPHLTFQVLTKRAKRMREWFGWIADEEASGLPPDHLIGTCASNYVDCDVLAWPWPLANVWIGVSVENQEYADLRVPELLRVPAAVRFVSYEPALGPIDFRKITDANGYAIDALHDFYGAPKCQGLDWIIVGGESGPKARSFDIRWAQHVVEHCRLAGRACFVKQMGSKPIDSMRPLFGEPDTSLTFKHRKGEDPAEWPKPLRVQQFPQVAP